MIADYDEALAFYVGTLGFTVVKDTDQPARDKRSVVIAPPGAGGTTLVLARASSPEQAAPVAGQPVPRSSLVVGVAGVLLVVSVWRELDAGPGAAACTPSAA